jgi:N6-adenosine-specific RNA methylase IME4
MTDAVQEIPVALCRASPTARPVQPIRVEVLARSIAEVGLRQPINVRPLDGGYEIRGGGHRHAAFVSLGRETIPAFVRTDDDLHAELAEIDENLIRNELSPAERAISIARRKAIYEELHPETAHGGDRKSSRQVGDLNGPERFTKDTADTTGASERTIQRDAGRGEAISEEHLRAVTGTSLDKGEELDALAKLPEDKRADIIERAKSGEKVSAKIEAKKDRRGVREEELGDRQRALPDKKFGLILADIPRHFHVHSDETGMDRAPENHYPTMSFDETCKLPVAALAADDCILVFWSTAASLIDDIEIMAEWGFVTLRPRVAATGRLLRMADGVIADPIAASGRYCSMQVWDKVRIGLGYWFRDRHEFILIGVRGNVVPPAPGTQDESLFSEPKGKHSAKPEHVASMIDRLWPTIPKIELFARRRRDGWDTWGLEAPDQFVDANNVIPPHDPDTGEIIESASEPRESGTGPTEQSDNRNEAARPVAELRNEGGGHVDHPDSASATLETTGAGEGATSSVPVRETTEGKNGEREGDEERSAGDEGNSGGSDNENQRGVHVTAVERTEQESDRGSDQSLAAETGDGGHRIGPGLVAAAEGLVLPVAPDLPDFLTRVTLSKNELAILNRISMEDCDRSEQVFITLLRKEPSLATVANQKRLLSIAERQGLMAEEGV